MKRMSRSALVALALALMIGTATATVLTIAPSKLVLRSANGAGESIDAIFQLPLPAGVSILGCEATMIAGGSTIATSTDFKYCWIDQNLIVYFDKKEVLASPVIAGNAGRSLTLRVAGALTVADDELAFDVPFDGVDEVDIVGAKPGR